MGTISYILFLLLTIYFIKLLAKRSTLSFKVLLAGWGIKLALSTVFILVFTYYYGKGFIYGDAGNFMHDSKLLHDFAFVDPVNFIQLLFGFADEPSLLQTTLLSETNIWSAGENGDLINDNRLIIRINTIIHFFSFGNTYVHALVLSFLAYLGIICLHVSFKNLTNNKILFFFALIAFPSVGFWTSGITKEAILIFAMGLFFYGLYKLNDKISTQSTLIFITAIVLLLFNKPYVGLILVSMTPLLLLAKYFKWHSAWKKSIGLILILITVLLTYMPHSVNLLDKISYKQKDLINMGKGGIFFVTDSSFCAFDYVSLNNFEYDTNNTITVLQETKGEYKLFGEHTFYPFTISPTPERYEVYLIQPPSASFIETTPIAYNRYNLFFSIIEVLNNTLIRPYPWDNGSQLKYFSFASNLLLLALLLIAILSLHFRYLSRKQHFIITYLLYTTFAILFIIGWTTPILGAIARYKIAAELLLIIIAFILLKPLKNAPK